MPKYIKYFYLIFVPIILIPLAPLIYRWVYGKNIIDGTNYHDDMNSFISAIGILLFLLFVHMVVKIILDNYYK